MKVEYSSNNSGGSWWLSDDNWRALEEAGWTVEYGQPYFCHSKYASLGGQRPTDLVECDSAKACKGHRAVRTFAEAMRQTEVRWLGALAKSAFREGLSLRDAVDEWERVTGCSSTDAGCACCGQPHSFTEYDDDGKYINSGPSARYEASWD